MALGDRQHDKQVLLGLRQVADGDPAARGIRHRRHIDPEVEPVARLRRMRLEISVRGPQRRIRGDELVGAPSRDSQLELRARLERLLAERPGDAQRFSTGGEGLRILPSQRQRVGIQHMQQTQPDAVTHRPQQRLGLPQVIVDLGDPAEAEQRIADGEVKVDRHVAPFRPFVPVLQVVEGAFVEPDRFDVGVA